MQMARSPRSGTPSGLTLCQRAAARFSRSALLAAARNEFQTFHLKRVRSRVRFFQLAILSLAIAEAIHLVVMDGVPLHDVLYGWLGVVVPVCLFSFGLVEQLLRAHLSACGSGSGTSIRNRLSDGCCKPLGGGTSDQFYFLTTTASALFFLGWSVVREALLATGAMVVACGATLAYTGEAAGSVIYYVVVSDDYGCRRRVCVPGCGAAAAHIVP